MTAAVIAALDARLPGLDALFDLDGVGARFARAWDTEVVDCRLLGARYDPRSRCVATYAVTLTSAQAVGVVELTPDGEAVRRAEDDAELPGLSDAADASQVVALLGVPACQVTLVRYRPGERAVLRYDVGSEVLFGKVVRSGAAELAAAFRHVHDGSGAGGPFAPEPTAVIERLGLVVLPAVEGRSLHGLLFDDSIPLADRIGACRAAGQALARLHAGPRPAWAATRADDVAELAGTATALLSIDPSLGERWSVALHGSARPELASSELVASHGALRTDQIVVGPDGPALLDLDGFCAAHPARDLGNLLAYLRWRAMRRPEDGAAASAGRDAVLDGYGRMRRLPPEDDLARNEGLSLLKIAARRYRNLDVAEWPLVPELVSAAAGLTGSTR